MAGQTLDDLLASARTAQQTNRPHRDVQVTLDAAVAEQVEAIDVRIADLEQEQADTAETADADLTEAARDARLGDPRPGEIREQREKTLQEIQEKIDALQAERDALTEGTLITLRFTQIPGQAWAEIAARHPARADVTIDRVYGYNYHETAKAAAGYQGPPERGALGQVTRAGRGYAERVLPPEDEGAEPAVEPVTAQQLESLFEVITGHEFERIASAIWDLNDYGPQQRIAAAGKASRAGSASRSS